MQQFNEQIIRIKEKLKTAKATDKDLKVFGADVHKYKLNTPLTPSQVADFETANKTGSLQYYSQIELVPGVLIIAAVMRWLLYVQGLF